MEHNVWYSELELNCLRWVTKSKEAVALDCFMDTWFYLSISDGASPSSFHIYISWKWSLNKRDGHYMWDKTFQAPTPNSINYPLLLNPLSRHSSKHSFISIVIIWRVNQFENLKARFKICKCYAQVQVFTVLDFKECTSWRAAIFRKSYYAEWHARRHEAIEFMKNNTFIS